MDQDYFFHPYLNLSKFKLTKKSQCANNCQLINYFYERFMQISRPPGISEQNNTYFRILKMSVK